MMSLKRWPVCNKAITIGVWHGVVEPIIGNLTVFPAVKEIWKRLKFDDLFVYFLGDPV